MNRPWAQGCHWLNSNDCHSVCRVIASLPVVSNNRKLRELFRSAVVPFLQPCGLIAFLEESGRLRLMDAETLTLVDERAVIHDGLALDCCGLPLLAAAPVSSSFFICRDDGAVSAVQVTGWGAVIEKGEPLIVQPLADKSPAEHSTSNKESSWKIQSMAIAPDQVTVVAGVRRAAIGWMLWFVNSKKCRTIKRVQIKHSPDGLAYSRRDDCLAAVSRGPLVQVTLMETRTMSVLNTTSVFSISENRFNHLFFVQENHIAVCYSNNFEGNCLLLDVPALGFVRQGGPGIASVWACDPHGKQLATVLFQDNGVEGIEVVVLDSLSLERNAIATIPRYIRYPISLAFNHTGERLVMCGSVADYLPGVQHGKTCFWLLDARDLAIMSSLDGDPCVGSLAFISSIQTDATSTLRPEQTVIHLRAGIRVQVRDLTSAPEYNGRYGVSLGQTRTQRLKGRVGVRLDKMLEDESTSQPTLLSVHEANLQVITANPTTHVSTGSGEKDSELSFTDADSHLHRKIHRGTPSE